MSDSIRLDTPESVDLILEPVSLGSRFVAALIDGLIQWIAGLLLTLALLLPLGIAASADLLTDGAFPAFQTSILLLGWGLLFSLYKILFEALWNGQTIGKRLTGIRVVQRSGLPVTFGQVLIRNLLRVVDFLPANYLIGCLTILLTGRSQRLGDLAAGTVVIRERPVVIPRVPTSTAAASGIDRIMLREYAHRLTETDLNPAREFCLRRESFAPEVRQRLARQIAASLIARMAWEDELTTTHEQFLVEVLQARAAE